jgi:hypothetical protein
MSLSARRSCPTYNTIVTPQTHNIPNAVAALTLSTCSYEMALSENTSSPRCSLYKGGGGCGAATVSLRLINLLVFLSPSANRK